MRRILILAALLPSIGYGAAACSWDKPGDRPFMGDVPGAVDAYTDIPANIRAALKRRMSARQYDEVVTITRTEIVGRAWYSGEIRDMHWRDGLCRGPVSRAGWPAGATERGLVYCEAGHCILVPTVCRNVSRISRLATAAARQASGGSSVDEALAGDGPIEISPGAGIAGGGLRASNEWMPISLPPPVMPAPAWLAPVLPQPTSLPGADPDSEAADARAVPAPSWPTYQWPIVTAQPAVALPAPVPAVPEAATWAAFAAGLLVIVTAARRGLTRRQRD